MEKAAKYSTGSTVEKAARVQEVQWTAEYSSAQLSKWRVQEVQWRRLQEYRKYSGQQSIVRHS